ncbi:MAG: bifunctional 5,10-methylenetetrahydrofolate dehydrogenase/5,10-methenyltetrahydrofolate cyclohydrolase [Eubacteriales bacterium]
MAEILSGAQVAQKLDCELQEKVAGLNEKGVFPTLCVIRVGENTQDLAYERGLSKKADKLGIKVKKFVYEESISQEELACEVKKIDADDKNHGILIFKPLPKHIDEKKVLMQISPQKDVDGVTDASMLGIYTGEKIGNPPCTPKACINILKHYNIELKGKKAVVLGRSPVVGKPLSLMLLSEDATVTVCHSKSENLEKICSEADILIVAVGKAKMVGKEFVSRGQIVIDVGINMGEDGKLCGDVNFEEAADEVSMISPVPGGVGTVTASVLMSHVIDMAERSKLC